MEVMDDVKWYVLRGLCRISGSVHLNLSSHRPQHVVVFIIGGATYEESLAVHQFNTKSSNTRIILGGSTIHSTASFLSSVEAAMEGVPRKTLRL